MTPLRIRLPFLPPTVNHAYVNKKTGGRFLSKEGRRFKESVAALLRAKCGAELRGLDENSPYGLGLRFSFPSVENATWPKSAAHRFKKWDVTNRIKLLEDALCAACKLDDSQFLDVVLQKRVARTAETTIWIWEYELDQIPTELTRVAPRLEDER